MRNPNEFECTTGKKKKFYQCTKASIIVNKILTDELTRNSENN